MREFGISIREALTQGLRPEPEMPDHQNFLADCFNMKPMQGGLEAHLSPTDPFNGGVSTDWPWPQMFDLEGEALLCEESDISSITKGSIPWTISGLQTKDPSSPGIDKSIPGGGGMWHAADLGEAWYLFKGNATVFKTGLHQIKGGSPRYFVDDEVTIQTGTTHKGRIVIGGFDSSNFWTSAWTGIFSTFQGDETAGVDFQFDDIGKNWVAWSSIGGGDMPLWSFFPSDVTYDIDLTKDRLLKRIKRNELGWMPMPFSGEVQKLATLGDNLIAYGENGIAAMGLTGAQNIRGVEDPVPSTYGVRLLSNLGVAGRGAVVEGQGTHVFLASNGTLWALTGDLQMQRLGYEEFMSGMTSGTLVPDYDPIEEDFYLSTANDGFVFTGNGLAEHRDHITGAFRFGGIRYGLTHAQGTSDISVITNEADMRLMARKRVQNVKVDIQNVGSPQASLEFRNDKEDSFETIGPQVLNKEGVAHLRASGVGFRAKIEGTLQSASQINEVVMRYQVSDKRAIRGPFPDAG